MPSSTAATTATPAEAAKQDDEAAPLHPASHDEAVELAAAAQSHQSKAPDAAMLTDRGLGELDENGSGDEVSGQG